GGIYSAVRTLDLGSRGALSTAYRVENGPTGLLEIFDVTGNVAVPPLVSIEPTVETWVPLGAGRIYGHFVMVWQTAEGERIIGKAETNYCLNLDQALPGVQFRDIRIDLSCTERHLHQVEEIVIFTPDLLSNALRDSDVGESIDSPESQWIRPHP